MPLLESLSSGVSAMQQFQQELNVIGNNIANVGTTGFKGASVQFSDALSQTIQAGGATGSMQVGTGVGTSAIYNQFTQGAINAAGPHDLAISGEGFFIVKDPNTGAQYATRDGSFSLDQNDYLVMNGTGMRVQGYTDGTSTTIGDIKVDNNQANSTAARKDWGFDSSGNIVVTLSDGTPSFMRGQVLLQNFSSPQMLVKEGSNLFSGMSLAGPLAQLTAPNTNGVGKLEVGQLEGSNVDLTTELSNLITTQRAYQASAHVVTTSDEVLQDLVNIKR